MEQKLSERLSAPPDCAECNGKGYAELIDGWERPCDACRGEGYVMDKAEQPTTQARYTVADYELAEQCVSAANVVTCDGYYEVDIEKVAETFAKARTTSLAAQDGLVEAVAEALLSAFLAGRGSVTADGRKAYKPAPSMADFRNIALSAIKEQHHD